MCYGPGVAHHDHKQPRRGEKAGLTGIIRCLSADIALGVEGALAVAAAGVALTAGLAASSSAVVSWPRSRSEGVPGQSPILHGDLTLSLLVKQPGAVLHWMQHATGLQPVWADSTQA